MEKSCMGVNGENFLEGVTQTLYIGFTSDLRCSLYLQLTMLQGVAVAMPRKQTHLSTVRYFCNHLT